MELDPKTLGVVRYNSLPFRMWSSLDLAGVVAVDATTLADTGMVTVGVTDLADAGIAFPADLAGVVAANVATLATAGLVTVVWFPWPLLGQAP